MAYIVLTLSSRIFEEGYYNIDIRASDNKGAAFIVDEDLDICQNNGLQIKTYPLYSFERFDQIPSFSLPKELENISTDFDIYPPSRITDLQMIFQDEDNITFSFTAPGDDLDEGIVKKYEVKFATSRDVLSDRSYIRLYNISSTVDSVNLKEFFITLHIKHGS